MTPPNWEDTFQDGQTFEPKVIDRLKQLGSSGVQSVSAADSSITIGGTASDPTIAVAGGGSLPAEWTVGDDGSLIIAPDSDLATFLLSVVAPAGFNLDSPTATMFKIVDENGRNVYEFDAYGDVNFRGSAGVGPSGLFLRSVDFPDAYVLMFSGSDDPGHTPFYYQNNNIKSSGPLFKILGKGAAMIGVNEAPLDEEILNSECGIWFDDTDGAAKIKFKGKSNDGTIVAGEIALT